MAELEEEHSWHLWMIAVAQRYVLLFQDVQTAKQQITRVLFAYQTLTMAAGSEDSQISQVLVEEDQIRIVMWNKVHLKKSELLELCIKTTASHV